VGKTTLISQISKARPKIADYPFTTLVPNLGVVRYGARPDRSDGGTEFVVADIPGLIEGAAEGRGLGHDFLKHVEYARVLCVMLDMAPDVVISPEEQLRVLLRELGDYQPDMLDRPRIIVGSRADLGPDTELPEGVMPLSSVTREGIPALVSKMAELVDSARRDEKQRASHEVVVHRPVVETVRVERMRPNEWEVVGRPALRAVRFQDLTNDEALAEVVRRLKDLGVDRLLNRAGAVDGDQVTVGQLSFEWFRDAATSGLDRGDHHRATRRERLARQGKLNEHDDFDDE
jgi:GTP-binding protein